MFDTTPPPDRVSGPLGACPEALDFVLQACAQLEQDGWTSRVESDADGRPRLVITSAQGVTSIIDI